MYSQIYNNYCRMKLNIFTALLHVSTIICFNVDVKNVLNIKGPQDSYFGYSTLMFSNDAGEKWWPDSPGYEEDNELLGASMGMINDTIVICAPLWKNMVSWKKYYTVYTIGRCFNMDKTLKISSTRNFKGILLAEDTKSPPENSQFFYEFSEIGFSISPKKYDNSELNVLLGAPGLIENMGGFVQYSATLQDPDIFFESFSSPRTSGFTFGTLTGYSITTGRSVDINNNISNVVVVGAPRYISVNGITGSVILANPEYGSSDGQTMDIKKAVFGKKSGSGFGSSVIFDDINNDGLDDLLVGAPLHYDTDSDILDVGAVFIYYGNLDPTMILEESEQVLTGSGKPFGRFGTAMQCIDDINKDSYNGQFTEVGIFGELKHYTICPNHRYGLGIRWRKSASCSYPGHSGKMKPDRAVNTKMSRAVLMIEGTLLQVGSGICRKCRETVYRIEEQWTSYTESSQAPVFQDPQYDDNIKQQPAQELDTDSKVTVSTPMGSCSEDCDRWTKKYEDTLPKNTQETVSIQMACSSEGFDRTCRLRKIVQTLPSNTLAEEMSGSSSQELTESSQELTSSQGSNWSTNEGINALTRYNHAVSQLSKGNLSPLKYQLRSAITDVTPQGKNYIKRKALQVVNTALEIIAPGQAEELMNLLLPQKSQVSSKDNEFMVLDFLKKLYNDSTSKTVKEQLVSVMANLTTKEKVMDMLSITKYKVEKVRALSLDAIKEKNEEPPKKRQRMDEGKLDHALSFFFDPAFHQLVSYGTREMKLENGEAIIIPDVVRTSCHSTMVNMYQTYCEEEHYDPLSRSTLYKILRACSAAKRKNLHGLDNITADGMQAFSDLEKIITSIYERGDTSHEIQKSIQSGLNKGKNYLKCQFKFHVSLESNCADHCIHWALSDPKEKCFQEECTHEHDTECMHCNLIADTLSQIERLPLTDDEVNDVSMAKLNISNWKGNILKTVNQDRSRIDHIDGLQPNQMFIVMDWAMKHLPQFHRETSSDWFGQKGVSWHVAVCMYKTGTEVNHQTMVHILESGKQDWYSVASILEHLLSTIKQQRPQVDEVFCRSDNAGCYHCGQLWSSLHAIGQRTGIQIKDYHYSEAQSGKSYCDAKIAHLRRKIRSYVTEGNNVRLPKEMKEALDSYGGVTGCQIAVVEISYQNQTLQSHKIKDIISVYNVDISENTLLLRKGYQIGQGKSLANISSLVNSQQDNTDIKVVHDFKVHQKIAGKIDTSFNKNNESQTSKIFPCTEEGCMKGFRFYHEYEQHMNCERHTFELENVTSFDKIKLRWAESCNEENQRSAISTAVHQSDSCNEREKAEKGWALRKERKQCRFKPKVHDFLRSIFNAGVSSHKKANAIEVAARMRTLTDDDNNRVFLPEECLRPSQIVSYFSKLASNAKKSDKKTESVNVSQDDDEFIASVFQDIELEEIRNDIQHQIVNI